MWQKKDTENLFRRVGQFFFCKWRFILIRKYKKKERKYTEEDLQKALREVSNHETSLRQAAKKYKIDKSVLSRRRKQDCKKRGRKPVFTVEEEARLAEALKTLAKWGFARRDISFSKTERYLKNGATVYEKILCLYLKK